MPLFRSISIAKPRGSRSGTPDTLYTMSSMSTMASSIGRPRSRDYDTGFPDMPRTTTWRHPEANTAPDACISAEDIDPAKTITRHHRHFLHHKYKRTTSHGVITSEMEQEYHRSQEALNSRDSAIGLEEDGGIMPSKDSADSMDRADESFKASHHSHAAGESTTTSQFEQQQESPRKRSLLGRIRSHRH